MIQAKIDRLNKLAQKSRTAEGLSTAEKDEQAALRQEYRDGFTRNLTEQLDNVRVVERDGSVHGIKPEKL